VPSASLDAAMVRTPAATAASLPEQPGVPQALASYRARHRRVILDPEPSQAPSQPRVSDDLASASVIPSPAPTPAQAPAHAQQPVQAAATPSAPASPASAPAYPSYTPLASQSGAYGSPEAYAESLVGAAQFACLQSLWDRESGWNVYAQNPTSGAYGIPQALPGSKMASAGADWATNGDTQVRWGILDYIDPVYGSPCGALAHENAQGWY
jgi:cell division protein FtsN